MTAVMDVDGLTDAVVAQRPVEQDEVDRGTLPWRGMTALASSAAFAVWTSLTCFVC